MYELRGDHQRLQEAQGQVTLQSPGSNEALLVVCYSTYLLLKYNCHINIETCVSMKGIMYLHDENPVKHVRCGHDDANLAPALKPAWG